VILDLDGAVEAEAVLGFALDQPIDKVRSLYGPAQGDLVALDLHLLSEDVIPYFFSCLTRVRPLYEVSLILKRLLCPSCIRNR
jgi:hypothetical protein